MTSQTPHPKRLFDSALDYISQGYSVIPLNGKTPLIQWAEFRKRIATEDEVKIWFETYGSSLTGLGLITGYTESLAVLDLEKEEDPSRFDIPNTVCAASGGGGRHYYFSIPTEIENAEVPSANLRRLNIEGDMKADGGYIVVPPSIHPETHAEYEWINPLGDMTLAPIPDWLVQQTKKTQWEQKDWKEILEGAVEGDRHNKTVSLTGKLLHHLPERDWEDVAFPLLGAWNETLNNPPLESKELTDIFKSLARKEITHKKTKNNPDDVEVGRKRTLLTVSAILNLPEADKPEFLVMYLVPENGITAISGHPGCGKSWFMLHMAHAVATGGMFLGQFPTKQGSVLIVDEENGVWELKRRMDMLGFSNDLPIYAYSQSGFKIDKKQDLEQLLKVVVDNNIKLVVFDPFVAIHSKVENNAEEAQEIMEALQQFNAVGASVMFIHHHRKSSFGGAGQSLRGSSAFSGRLDSHISVDKSNETITSAHLDIEHAKSRRGKAYPPFGVVMTETDTHINLTYGETTGERTPKRNIARKHILEILEQSNMGREEIIEAIKFKADVGSKNIDQALKDMETDKVVHSYKDGKKKMYALSAVPVIEKEEEIL